MGTLLHNTGLGRVGVRSQPGNGVYRLLRLVLLCACWLGSGLSNVWADVSVTGGYGVQTTVTGGNSSAFPAVPAGYNLLIRNNTGAAVSGALQLTGNNVNRKFAVDGNPLHEYALCELNGATATYNTTYSLAAGGSVTKNIALAVGYSVRYKTAAVWDTDSVMYDNIPGTYVGGYTTAPNRSYNGHWTFAGTYTPTGGVAVAIFPTLYASGELTPINGAFSNLTVTKSGVYDWVLDIGTPPPDPEDEPESIGQANFGLRMRGHFEAGKEVKLKIKAGNGQADEEITVGTTSASDGTTMQPLFMHGFDNSEGYYNTRIFEWWVDGKKVAMGISPAWDGKLYDAGEGMLEADNSFTIYSHVSIAYELPIDNPLTPYLAPDNPYDPLTSTDVPDENMTKKDFYQAERAAVEDAFGMPGIEGGSLRIAASSPALEDGGAVEDAAGALEAMKEAMDGEGPAISNADVTVWSGSSATLLMSMGSWNVTLNWGIFGSVIPAMRSFLELIVYFFVTYAAAKAIRNISGGS